MIDRRPVARKCAAALLGALLTGSVSGHAAPELTFLAHTPESPVAHPPLIVLLHGVGTDERDMIGLWRQLPPDFVVVSPRAPFPEAGGGYRWYGKAARERDIEVSRKIVDLIVDAAVERFHADPARVFLGGFSQGAVMTYEAVLREPGRFRGGAVLSGSLFPSEVRALSGRPRATYPPLFVGHGTADARIPLGTALGAKVALVKLGVPIDFHAYAGMAHMIGDAESSDLRTWLAAHSQGP